jgi:hypothetical protein
MIGFSFLKILVYHNVWLSSLSVLSYGLFSLWIGFSFSLSYAVILFCSVQVAYGIDNILDQTEDLHSWKNTYLQHYPKLSKWINYVLVGICFILGIYESRIFLLNEILDVEHFLIQLVMIGVFLATVFIVLWIHLNDFWIVSSSPVLRAITRWNIRRWPVIKTLLVASVWWLFLLGIPLLLHGNFIFQKMEATHDYIPLCCFFLISVLHFISLSLSTWFSQIRDIHRDVLHKPFKKKDKSSTYLLRAFEKKHVFQKHTVLFCICLFLFLTAFLLGFYLIGVTENTSTYMFLTIPIILHSMRISYILYMWDKHAKSVKQDMILDSMIVFI